MALIIPRSEWGADPQKRGGRITTPTPFLHIHHSVTLCNGCSVDQEKAHMRRLEADSGFNIGFPYSFAVFPSGRVYEGQGWGIEGAHTCNGPPITQCWNRTGHGFAFIGNHETARPTQAALQSMRKLIVLGVERGHQARDATIRPHDAVKPTLCPGKFVKEQMSFLIGGDGGEDETMMKDFLAGAEWAADNPDALKPPAGKSKAWNHGFRMKRDSLAGRRALSLITAHRNNHPSGDGADHPHPFATNIHRHAEGRTGPPIE